jgi:hypothetical protein
MENQPRKNHSGDIANRPERCNIPQFRHQTEAVPHQPTIIFPEPVASAPRNLRLTAHPFQLYSDRAITDLLCTNGAGADYSGVKAGISFGRIGPAALLRATSRRNLTEEDPIVKLKMKPIFFLDLA